MPPSLVGTGRLLVATLVVADHRADVTDLGRPPAATKQHRAADVQRSADLLQRHLWVFPPAAGWYAPTRTPARSTPGSDAAPAPRTAALRSAPAPPPTWPPGNCARPSRGKTPPAAPAPALCPSHWSGSTSARPLPR